jgi:hypothetical protein
MNDGRSDASSHERTPMKDPPGDPPRDKSALDRPVTTKDTARANGQHNRAPTKAGDPPKTPSSPRTRMTPDEFTGTSDPELLLHLVCQASNAGTRYVKCNNKDISQGAILAALKGIGPQNEIEGMLAVQMVSTHNAAMECLRRAAVRAFPRSCANRT